MATHVRAGSLSTLTPLLPLLFAWEGQPLTLKSHEVFAPYFRAHKTSGSHFQTGRQVGKSLQNAVNSCVDSVVIPYFKTLHITPLYEQIRRFSNLYIRPLIDDSPLSSLWTDPQVERSVLQRSLKNGSLMQFSFACLDVSRIRGIATHRIKIDELQDMSSLHLPIIYETLSASKWAIYDSFGTPKSFDNPMQHRWESSSQAEWMIPCTHCTTGGYPTINIPALEHHLDRMIGPAHEGVSPQTPGTICYRCGQWIQPASGRWIHRFPDRRWHLPGFHIPQIVMPFHYGNRDKWSTLVAKREGWGNTSTEKFTNEVLGEPTATGYRLISSKEIKAACLLPWKNNPRQPDHRIYDLLDRYPTRILGIDWGGGGEEEVSFTTLALLGYTPGGKIHCLWGKRLSLGNDHAAEAAECMHWIRQLRPTSVAHDFTGAGDIRETLLIQQGYDPNRLLPMFYTGPRTKIIVYKPPSGHDGRGYYQLNRTRSLLYAIQAIKAGVIQFFEYDYIDQENRGLLHDFLSLVEEKVQTRSAGDLYIITRNPGNSDDFAHAVNIAASGIWYQHGWPNYARALTKFNISKQMQHVAGDAQHGWELEPKSSW